jgi:YggT family protein
VSGIQLALAIRAIGQFYGLLIFIYVLMSWFPMRGALYDAYRVLGSVVEPYLALFRNLIPPMGNFDFSPLVAYFVLQIVVNYVLVPLALKL